MALFGSGKKKDAPGADMGAPMGPPDAPASPAGIPIDQVSSLQKQGMSNYQIVQTLQQQGYSSQQIYDAINQASIKSGVNPSAEDMPQGEDMGPSAPPGGMQQGMQRQMPPPPMPQQQQQQSFAPGIEETVEAIVDEKWKEVSDAFSKLNDWKDSTDTSISKLQQAVSDLKSDMDNLHKAIVSKIGEYDQNLLNVGTEIKAMEKVFSKVLPTFSENVNELARVAKNLKAKK